MIEARPSQDETPPTKDIERLKGIEQIKIPRLVLREPVTITSTDVFGRPAEVTLEPTEAPGWFWRVGGKDIPLQMKMLHTDKRHFLTLEHGQDELHICEHLLPLRFAGVDGVRIIAKTKWLPYDGSGLIFWKAIENKLRYDGTLSPMQQPVKSAFSKQEKSGLRRLVSIDNTNSNQLIVQSTIDYKKFGGAKTVTQSFPLTSPDQMVDLFKSISLGNPPWADYFFKTASRLGWPHYDKMLWPKKGDDPEKILHEIALHRMFDFLGAMAVIPKSGEYLLGDLFSDCGNHASDVALIRSIEDLFPAPKAKPDTYK